METIYGYWTNPDRTFRYLSSAILWDKFFHMPFPKSTKNYENAGTILLSHYFHIKEIEIKNKKTKALCPNKKYYTVPEYEREDAFLSICKFLRHHKKPFMECYLEIPNHNNIMKAELFSPMRVCFEEPKYPLINKAGDRWMIPFKVDTYSLLHYYMYGEKVKIIPDNQTKFFPFSSFRGFVLL